MGNRLIRNAVITDPETGQRRVLKANTVVDDALVPLVDPRAFGEDVVRLPEPAPEQAPADFRGVPLEALLAYADGRGLDVPEDADGHDILAALIDADEALTEHVEQLTSQLAAAAAERAATSAPLEDAEPLTDEQVAEVLSHNFDEVNELLDLAPEHAAQVLAAEAQGKNRKGIVEGPHAAEGTG